MLKLNQIKKDVNLVNDIDWDMGPEDAVTQYLEWGNNPALGHRAVRSKNDYSVYFVINTWKAPKIYLIRRDSEDAQELACLDIPAGIKDRYMESIGHLKGVYAIEGEVKDWLKQQLADH